MYHGGDLLENFDDLLRCNYEWMLLYNWYCCCKFIIVEEIWHLWYRRLTIVGNAFNIFFNVLTRFPYNTERINRVHALFETIHAIIFYVIHSWKKWISNWKLLCFEKKISSVYRISHNLSRCAFQIIFSVENFAQHNFMEINFLR